MNDKFLSLLGMARRAGRAEFGYDKSLSCVHAGRARAVFCAADLSEKTKRGLIYAAEENSADIITVPYSQFELTGAVGLKTGIVCITDAGFAKKLVSLLDSANAPQS